MHEAKFERRLKNHDAKIESVEAVEERISVTVIPIVSRLQKIDRLVHQTSERLNDLNLKVVDLKADTGTSSIPKMFNVETPTHEPSSQPQAFPSVGKPTPT